MADSDDTGRPATRHSRWWVVVISLTLFAAGLGFVLPQLFDVEPHDQLMVGVPDRSSTSAPVPPLAAVKSDSEARDIPIYYVGRREGLLFREFRTVEAHGTRTETAVAALMEIQPLDPNYETLWSPAKKVSVTREGDVITVDLSRDAFNLISDSKKAKLAVRQLVYTVTGAEGDPDNRLSVRLLIEGSPILPEVFGEQSDYRREGLVPMPQVWITGPVNQETLPEGSVQVKGTAKPDSPTPVLSVVDKKSGETIAARMVKIVKPDGGWNLWEATVVLRPGNYDLQAKEAGPGGRLLDAKTVKVSAVGQ